MKHEAHAREMRVAALGRVLCAPCGGSGVRFSSRPVPTVCGACNGRRWHYADKRTSPSVSWFENHNWRKCTCGECVNCLERVKVRETAKSRLYEMAVVPLGLALRRRGGKIVSVQESRPELLATAVHRGCPTIPDPASL